jgi:RHS repeat-associated protein
MDNGPAGKYSTVLTLDVEGHVLATTDALGRWVLTSDFCPGGGELHRTSVDAGQRWMLYDAAGQHLLAWDSREHQIRCTYDAERRPVGLYVTTGTGPERLAEQIIYGEGLATAETQNLRGAPYQHQDEAGLVNTVQRDFKGNTLASARQLLADYVDDVDWSSGPALADETFTADTTFDALNRVTTATSPDGDLTTPTFNERSLLASVSVKLASTAAVATVVAKATYDAKGQRQAVAYGNGAATAYSYDSETFRLTELKTTRPGDTGPLQNLSYTYDPVGNVTRLRDEAQDTIFFDNQVVSPSADYTYDAIYRLVRATGREQIGQAGQPQTTWNDAARVVIPLPTDGHAMRNYTENYTYDEVGNFLQIAHTANLGNWTRTYAYDEPTAPPANNLLTSTTVGGATERYTYDAHGNIASMPHLSLIQSDWKDQLQATATQIVNDGTPETTYYTYDSAGQRVVKATNNQNGERTAERIYLGDYEVYRTYDVNGNVVRESHSLHVSSGADRICVFETTTIDNNAPPTSLPSALTRYQLSNHLGSAMLELDGAAAIITYEQYYPYGSTSLQSGRSTAEVSLKRYRYTGKERDGESGFYYHGARYYAPWLGRWMSPDPAGLIDGPNRYSYARNNPIRLVDPDGSAAGDPPKLGGLWSYGTRLKNKLGHRVQQHHPISVKTRQLQRKKYYSRKISEKLEIPGVSKRPGERVILAETGKGYEHTLVRDSQKAIEARVAAGQLRSESQLVHETLKAHRAAWKKAGKVLDEKAFATAVLENQAAVHKSLSETVKELRRVKVKPGIATKTVKQAGTEALKLGGEEIVKSGAKTGLKEGAKLAATKIAKFIPILGIVVGVGLVAADLKRGEKWEAALDAAEAIPVVGDVVGAGHFGVQIGLAVNTVL